MTVAAYLLFFGNDYFLPTRVIQAPVISPFTGTFVANFALLKNITPSIQLIAMTMSEKFVQLHEASLCKGGMKIQHGPVGSVIKRTALQDGKAARKIIHHAAKPSVEAIMENEIITGVRIKCACGEVIKVYFQYDQSS